MTRRQHLVFRGGFSASSDGHAAAPGSQGTGVRPATYWQIG